MDSVGMGSIDSMDAERLDGAKRKYLVTLVLLFGTFLFSGVAMAFRDAILKPPVIPPVAHEQATRSEAPNRIRP